jgi:hypothetical protein
MPLAVFASVVKAGVLPMERVRLHAVSYSTTVLENMTFFAGTSRQNA